MPLYYEDFEIGREFESEPRTVMSADVGAFAALTGDRNPIHLDAAAARAAGFEQPVAHGVLGLALATGLVSQMRLTRGTLVALLSVTWKFIAPVYPGDQVAVRLRVSSRRETSRAGRGIVTLAAELRNQRGEVVQAGELVELVKQRGT